MKRIVIIGGGLAGLIASIRLARHGHQVLLVEKQEYPHHKVCGEYISMEVYDFLERENLLPEEKLPKINKLCISSTSGASAIMALKMGGFGISRYLFEKFLADLAISANVRIIHREAVDIQSTTVTLKGGEVLIADLIIGAYGKRTKLDKTLNRDFIEKRSPYVGIKFHAKLPDYDPHLISLHNFPGGYCGICKVENEIANICYLVHRDKVKEAGSIEELERQVLSENPLLKEALLDAGRIFEKPLVINEISFLSKTPVEDNIIMIGDAAGMITPLCGNGMAMAIHSAKIISDLINNNSKVTVAELTGLYSRLWKETFASRLAWGRLVQKYLFGKPWASGLSVFIGKNMPFLAKAIITKTHGSKI